MRLMEGDHVGPFNLGNPGEFTMLELAQVICLHSDNISNFYVEFFGGYAIYKRHTQESLCH